MMTIAQYLAYPVLTDEDLGTNAETDGWHYDGATGILSLTATNTIYGLAGTNAIWDVAVRAEAPGVAVRANGSGLQLASFRACVN